ncbi:MULTISPECIES: class I SAM-dependent methyltransferase [Methylobacterium]|uniref:Methyltransferase type 11 n=2 Tax=Methylobacterium TaxID=407 RepID=A0A0C6FRZ3_9HYPH|nr:class I SAM-dependent methyltransferase [Methylobacterium aquaticum]BAQ49787.1 methyltransferase type 11 [Methylobacterium aquaticum]
MTDPDRFSLTALRRALARRLDPDRGRPPAPVPEPEPEPVPDTLDALLARLIEAITARATTLAMDGSFYHEVGPAVDGESLEARSAEDLLAAAFRPGARLLDFGCGAMHSRPFIESLGYAWQGVDYLDSVSGTVRDEVGRLGDAVRFYDGRVLPFADGEFDVVWAMVVLHHVQHVDLSFGEIARVLRPGGKLIGQVAYLEQMQDYGTFNFTPYGLKVAAQGAGLRLTRVDPKHDAFVFLLRRLLITLTASDDTPFNAMMGPEGVVHRSLIETGRRLGLDIRMINLLRLLFCTHFVFEIEKPAL